MTIAEKLLELRDKISIEMGNNNRKVYGSLNRLKDLFEQYNKLKDGLSRLSQEDEEKEIPKPAKYKITESKSKLNFDDNHTTLKRYGWL